MECVSIRHFELWHFHWWPLRNVSTDTKTEQSLHFRESGKIQIFWKRNHLPPHLMVSNACESICVEGKFCCCNRFPMGSKITFIVVARSAAICQDEFTCISSKSKQKCCANRSGNASKETCVRSKILRSSITPLQSKLTASSNRFAMIIITQLNQAIQSGGAIPMPPTSRSRRGTTIYNVLTLLNIKQSVNERVYSNNKFGRSARTTVADRGKEMGEKRRLLFAIFYLNSWQRFVIAAGCWLPAASISASTMDWRSVQHYHISYSLCLHELHHFSFFCFFFCSAPSLQLVNSERQ